MIRGVAVAVHSRERNGKAPIPTWPRQKKMMAANIRKKKLAINKSEGMPMGGKGTVYGRYRDGIRTV